MKLFQWFWRQRWWWAVAVIRYFWKSYHKQRQSRIAAIDQAFIDSLPTLAYTLGGRAMEPINFVFVGSRVAIANSFQATGWVLADPPTPINLIRAFMTILVDRGYPAGPVTPLQIDGHIHDLDFQKPTRQNRLRRRHHIRLWQLPYRTSAGQEVWAASSSYDEGFKFTLKSIFLTHSIAPGLDLERQFIIDNLAEAGGRQAGWFDGSGPRAGINAFGDDYRTDGRVAVLEFS